MAIDHRDDEELVDAAKGGDQAAFSALVERHQARLRQWIAGVLVDREDAWDCAQEVFLDAWRSLPRFDRGKPFLPWLRSIARHRLSDHLRSRYRHRSRHCRLVDEALVDLASEPDAADQHCEEELRALRRCLQTLDERRQQLIHWRYRSGLALAEIDRRMARQPGYAANLLMRLRRWLASCLDGTLAEMRR